mmetsp:Transcript_160945/g.516590  ORF Transcript_160945/g.516590 Transcript_160945/m.516590 type:complete len:365 (+) Transcript_160945:1383-2477(+)
MHAQVEVHERRDEAHVDELHQEHHGHDAVAALRQAQMPLCVRDCRDAAGAGHVDGHEDAGDRSRQGTSLDLVRKPRPAAIVHARGLVLEHIPVAGNFALALGALILASRSFVRLGDDRNLLETREQQHASEEQDDAREQDEAAPNAPPVSREVQVLPADVGGRGRVLHPQRPAGEAQPALLPQALAQGRELIVDEVAMPHSVEDDIGHQHIAFGPIADAELPCHLLGLVRLRVVRAAVGAASRAAAERLLRFPLPRFLSQAPELAPEVAHEAHRVDGPLFGGRRPRRKPHAAAVLQLGQELRIEQLSVRRGRADLALRPLARRPGHRAPLHLDPATLAVASAVAGGGLGDAHDAAQSAPSRVEA